MDEQHGTEQDNDRPDDAATPPQPNPIGDPAPTLTNGQEAPHLQPQAAPNPDLTRQPQGQPQPTAQPQQPSQTPGQAQNQPPGQPPGQPSVRPQNQPSWLGYAAPMYRLPVGNDRIVGGATPELHERDWEGQVAAAMRGPMPWGFLAYFLGFGAFYLCGLVITGVFRANATALDSPSGGHGVLVLVALIPNVFLGLGPAVVSWWKGQGLVRDYGIVPKGRDFGIGVLCGLTAFGIGLVINLFLQRFVFGKGGTGNSVQQLSGLAGGKDIWLALAALFVVFGAPLTEELLVRGALWGALEYFRIHRYWILLLTSLLFAFMHQEPQVTLALFCQGIAIGTARMITGRIGASMIAHATNNLIPAILLFAYS